MLNLNLVIYNCIENNLKFICILSETRYFTSLPYGLLCRLLEYPHNMAADFPQEELCKRINPTYSYRWHIIIFAVFSGHRPTMVQCRRILRALMAQLVKNLHAVQETWVWSLAQEYPLQKEMAIHSSILVWRNYLRVWIAGRWDHGRQERWYGSLRLATTVIKV